MTRRVAAAVAVPLSVIAAVAAPAMHFCAPDAKDCDDSHPEHVITDGWILVDPLGNEASALDIAVPFVAEREGWRGAAYCDESGHATIGYGRKLADDCDHLDRYWPETEPESRAWLTERVEHVLADIRHHVTAPLAAHEEAALASLAYNIGAAALDGSKLLLMINANEPRGVIVGEWVTWDKEHRGGRLVRSRGLSERRALEVLLYLGGTP